MNSEDEKLENILVDPWLAKPATRWSLSTLFVLAALFFIRPLIVQNLLSRADAYASNGMYNNTARECKKAILIDRNNMKAWNTLGSSYKNQDDLDNAVNTYLNAANIDPSNKIAHFKAAMIFALEQNYNRAIPHFERVRQFGPENFEQLANDPFLYYRSSLEMLSLCYERTGKLDKQQGVLEELAQTYYGHKTKK